MNALRVGSVIFGLFIRGMVMIPVTTEGLGTGLGTLVVYGLLTFKALMYMLIIIELYMVFKNKKNS